MASITIKPPKLTDYQKAILESECRFTITLASTKSGKTFSHIWWLFQQAHLEKYKKGDEFWWVAPISSQAEIAFNRIRRKVERLGGAYKIRQSTGKLSITTPLGTVIRFKSADKPDSLYGEDVQAAVFDEFTRAKRDAWDAIYSTLTFTGGKCKLIGNFKGLANWGWQLVKKTLKDRERGIPTEFEFHKITAWDAVKAGVLKREIVEQAQRDFSPMKFAELYLAEPVDSPDQLISNTNIENFFTNNFVKKTGKKYITADIAFYGSDKFVVGVWDGLVLIDILIMEKSSSTEVENAILDLRMKHNVPFSNIIYDADGLGSFLTGRLGNAIAFVNNSAALPPLDGERKEEYSNLKSQCYFMLAKKMNANEMYCEVKLEEQSEEDMTQELQAIRNATINKDGKLSVLPKDKVKELISRSPDYSDMLMMRMYAELVTETSYLTW